MNFVYNPLNVYFITCKKMTSPGSSGRKRTTGRQYSAEDQALNQIASEVSLLPVIFCSFINLDPAPTLEAGLVK